MVTRFVKSWISKPVKAHLILGFQTGEHFIIWIKHKLDFLRLVNMTLLENLVKMVPVGRMALFYVAHQLVLFFVLAGAVLDMALERIVYLMI